MLTIVWAGAYSLLLADARRTAPNTPGGKQHGRARLTGLPVEAFKAFLAELELQHCCEPEAVRAEALEADPSSADASAIIWFGSRWRGL